MKRSRRRPLPRRNPTASDAYQTLYEGYAKLLPWYDRHGHCPPQGAGYVRPIDPENPGALSVARDLLAAAIGALVGTSWRFDGARYLALAYAYERYCLALASSLPKGKKNLALKERLRIATAPALWLHSCGTRSEGLGHLDGSGFSHVAIAMQSFFKDHLRIDKDDKVTQDALQESGWSKDPLCLLPLFSPMVLPIAPVSTREAEAKGHDTWPVVWSATVDALLRRGWDLRKAMVVPTVSLADSRVYVQEHTYGPYTFVQCALGELTNAVLWQAADIASGSRVPQYLYEKVSLVRVELGLPKKPYPAQMNEWWPLQHSQSLGSGMRDMEHARLLCASFAADWARAWNDASDPRQLMGMLALGADKLTVVRMVMDIARPMLSRGRKHLSPISVAGAAPKQAVVDTVVRAFEEWLDDPNDMKRIDDIKNSVGVLGILRSIRGVITAGSRPSLSLSTLDLMDSAMHYAGQITSQEGGEWNPHAVRLGMIQTIRSNYRCPSVFGLLQ